MEDSVKWQVNIAAFAMMQSTVFYWKARFEAKSRKTLSNLLFKSNGGAKKVHDHRGSTRAALKLPLHFKNGDLGTAVRAARAVGYTVIAGVDEAGAGALCGPVVAAAVAIGAGTDLSWVSGLRDSKKMTARNRFKVRSELLSASSFGHDVRIATATVSAEEIDSSNIRKARAAAMASSARSISLTSGNLDLLFVDGDFTLQIAAGVGSQQAVIGGDTCVCVIAAASVIAKETRDDIMREIHAKWPMYGFDKHKGYATRDHFAALAEFGPCPVHRKTFKPVRRLLKVSAGST